MAVPFDQVTGSCFCGRATSPRWSCSSWTALSQSTSRSARVAHTPCARWSTRRLPSQTTRHLRRRRRRPLTLRPHHRPHRRLCHRQENRPLYRRCRRHRRLLHRHPRRPRCHPCCRRHCLRRRHRRASCSGFTSSPRRARCYYWFAASCSCGGSAGAGRPCRHRLCRCRVKHLVERVCLDFRGGVSRLHCPCPKSGGSATART